MRVRRGSAGASRLGLAVGKRAGNSPCRNRIKRRLREIFRRSGRGIPVGVDLVVTARGGGAATCSYADLERDFQRTLERAVSGSTRRSRKAKRREQD